VNLEFYSPAKERTPCFEINYGICVCNAGLEFVFFIQHTLLPGATAQSNLIAFHMPVSQSSCKQYDGKLALLPQKLRWSNSNA
jgi:hypothetical protein